MERLAFSHLKEWKNRKDRKPLIIRGARQVGKTWLMREFGQKEYSQTAYVNFESSKSLKSLFEGDFNIQRILTALQIETGLTILPSSTLIIFDEIQEAEGALTSLKYFCEEAPQYHIIAAGSLLGIAFHKRNSFPVGKVEFLNLYPLTFEEFLLNSNKQLLTLIKDKNWELVKTFNDKYIQLLREYYFIGGMPEVVASYITEKNFLESRTIQKRILSSYELDFSKHAPGEIVPRIRMLWNSVLAQLSKENRKFIYGAVKSGSRAKDYELALSWLIDSGLVHKVSKVSKPGMPLKAYEDISAFKLFIHDVGLLGAMGDIDVKTILEGNVIFTEFKVALSEQFVLQQLKAIDNLATYYWSAEKADAEIDFLIQWSGAIIPIEVKAEENLKSKSLRVFCEKFNHTNAIRVSMSNYREESWLKNLPLYAISELVNI